jgi:hypothetical protein
MVKRALPGALQPAQPWTAPTHHPGRFSAGMLAAAKAVCERIEDLSSYAELLKE